MSEKKNGQSRSMTAVGISVLVANILMGGELTMSQSYANYAYTDLAGISAGTMATCMSVVNVIAIIITFISGAIVQRSRTRFGQFRPWILFGSIVQMIGGYMLFISYPSKLTAMVLISAGYLLANSSMDFIFSAKNGLYSRMAGTSSDARTLIVGRETQGRSIGMILVSLSVVNMILYFGRSNEAAGYRMTQLVFTVFTIIGAIILFRVGRDYDKPMPAGAAAGPGPQTQAGIGEMLKGVLTNRAALLLMIADVSRLAALYVFVGTIVYECQYVLGNMQYMTFIMLGTNVAIMFGAFCAPSVAKKLGGRKRTCLLFSILTGISYAGIIFAGKSFTGFTVFAVLGNFCTGFINTVDVPMYMDAGEYWLQKKGKDTRVFIMSMYNIAMKIGIAVSAIVIASILSASGFQKGVVMTAAQQGTFTLVLGLVLCVLNVLPAFFLLFYPIADKDIQGIILDNAKKYGGPTGSGAPGGAPGPNEPKGPDGPVAV